MYGARTVGFYVPDVEQFLRSFAVHFKFLAIRIEQFVKAYAGLLYRPTHYLKPCVTTLLKGTELTVHIPQNCSGPRTLHVYVCFTEFILWLSGKYGKHNQTKRRE